MPESTPALDNPDLAFALMLARRAGRIMTTHLGAAATAKDDGTPVTAIDKQINEMVAAAVAEHGDRMLGEEDKLFQAASDGRTWVCDPIDGTWLFAAGVPGSVFSLALVVAGQPVLGVVHDPWTNRTFYGITGGGAFANGRPIQVNTAEQVTGACLVLPGSPTVSFHPGKLFTAALNAGADVVTSGSAIQDAMMVPLGFAAASVYPYTSPWDLAAIAVIVREAGGRITDLAGQAHPRFDAPVFGAIVSNGNGNVHRQLVAMVAAS